MLKNDGNITRYIGGGKIYFTPKGETDVREFGECQEAKVSISTEVAEAINKDSCMAVKAGKFVKAINATIEFTTQNISIENMALARLGKIEDVEFQTGETLPDGSSASENTTIKCIKAGSNPIIEGSIKFVGDECGDEKPVLIVHNAVLSPSGEFAYIADDVQTLGFSGEVLDTDKGYFDEYRMEVKKD